ncbi:Diphthamide biosynthesis protein 4 [Arachnomyces sp. PD_36]|nr:Diphthamide biosynthesis protein 4 [Arachnomyces sp. PD_36]
MASPIPLDPYAVLGVPKDATLPAIRTAHRKLVLKCHPDKIKDENQRSQGQDEFQKVQQAYELLSDESKRTRYDQKVKLAELRKEALEREGAASSSPYAGMKSGSASSFEYRGGRVYEERVPAGTRFFEEEIRFTDEPRPSSRKTTDYAKRSGNRDADDRKRSKHTDPKVDPIRSSKERAREARDFVKAGHEDRQKHRDRERRREFSEKYSRTTAQFVESDDSDSDGSYYRRRSSRRVYDDTPRKSKAESSSRRHESRRSRDDGFVDEYGSKHESLHMDAREYIQRSKVTIPAESERRPRSSRSPSHYYEVRESPQPDSARRSSARPRRESGRPDSSGRDRRGSIDIVEPLSRSHEPRKPPTLAATVSAPMNIKVPQSPKISSPQLTRSSTGHVRERRDPPPVRRSETTPLYGMTSRRSEHAPVRSSKLKGAEISDSGYSSPGTPEMYQGNSPPKSSTKYTIVDEDEEYIGRHPAVVVSPDPSYRRQKSTSPIRTERQPTTIRPSPKTTRTATATYAYPSEALPTRQTLSRHESARAVPSSRNSPPLRSSTRDRLFGEMTPEEPSSKFSEDQVRFAAKIRPEDVSYGSYNVRKGSVDTATPRDAYPRSQYEHRQPGLGRSESYAY